MAHEMVTHSPHMARHLYVTQSILKSIMYHTILVKVPLRFMCFSLAQSMWHWIVLMCGSHNIRSNKIFQVERVSRIKRLLNHDWVVCCHHLLWEGNAAADFIARLGVVSSTSLTVWDSPPPSNAPVLRADCLGTTFLGM